MDKQFPAPILYFAELLRPFCNSNGTDETRGAIERRVAHFEFDSGYANIGKITTNDGFWAEIYQPNPEGDWQYCSSVTFERSGRFAKTIIGSIAEVGTLVANDLKASEEMLLADKLGVKRKSPLSPHEPRFTGRPR